MIIFLLHAAYILAGLFVAGIACRFALFVSENIVRASFLDLLISIFTWIPWAVGFFLNGRIGMLSALFSQFLGIYVFCFLDRAIRGKPADTLTAAQGRVIGPLRNHLALLATTPATVAFLAVRLTEMIVYPPVAWLAKLPTYQTSDWVNLSRHKYHGLTGPDLLWCWYCDCMTGLWALGSEMLRNIESFWCPIRFRDEAKNRNAATDFPDVEKWAPADAGVEEAIKVFEEHYDGKRKNSWFGHPDRREP
jgi:hypothetical protein